VSYPFLKGHGTHNDFVLLPDPDGTVHGDLSVDRVRALCDRRGGIGGDGVLRVIRTAAMQQIDPSSVVEPVETAEWFMDYRNADGSIAEMCGNGIRVFARHLAEAGAIDPTGPVPIATRDGVKTITFAGDDITDDITDHITDDITVDMGTPKILEDTSVAVIDEGVRRTWAARHVDMGNPHAVAFVDSLDDAGSLLAEPDYDHAAYPHGVNIEFVVRRGPAHVAMRVHERGSAETQSCGTGACAVMVAAALLDQQAGGARNVPYRVDLPGGTLMITWTGDDRVEMTGPAVIVAGGLTEL
jgi:diaminopimelate epimerase